MEKVILIGAGGHSVSVVDCLDTTLYELSGFIDENKKGNHMGYPIFGSKIDDIPEYEKYSFFVSIGDVYFRKLWFEKLLERNLRVINIIDRTAIISNTSKIGIGNFIGKYAIVNAKSVIGDNNIINTKALVEHECFVGNNVHLSTNSTINGNVIVEDNVFLGSSAVCNGQLRIGHDAVVGSGSVIIKNVEPDTTVVGVPAKIVKRR